MTTMQRLHASERVFVERDERDHRVLRYGTVTRMCTDGERAWVSLEGGGKVRVLPEWCSPITKEQEKRTSVAMTDFGKDHWSTFAYLETRIVDHKGVPRLEHMRCHADRHPLLVWVSPFGAPNDGSAYPTLLKGGRTILHHDDWDCVDDLAHEGLLANVGKSVNPCFRLTEAGVAMASRLRAHKGSGGSFSTFAPT